LYSEFQDIVYALKYFIKKVLKLQNTDAGELVDIVFVLTMTCCIQQYVCLKATLLMSNKALRIADFTEMKVILGAY